MKLYKCHKTVMAAVITDIILQDGEVHLMVEGTHHPVKKPSMTNYVPRIGDYLVEYSDGHRSLSSKEAFEGGYTLCEEH